MSAVLETRRRRHLHLATGGGRVTGLERVTVYSIRTVATTYLQSRQRTAGRARYRLSPALNRHIAYVEGPSRFRGPNKKPLVYGRPAVLAVSETVTVRSELFPTVFGNDEYANVPAAYRRIARDPRFDIRLVCSRRRFVLENRNVYVPVNSDRVRLIRSANSDRPAYN